MSAQPFRLERLAGHDRRDFDCGVESLNRYLQSQAGQDVRRRASTCFLAIEAATERIAGYYTLAATGVALTELPNAASRRLPRYPTIPAVLVGRLAVDTRFQGQKLGGALLFDAIKRTILSEIAVFAVVVDAKDDRAVSFYERYGFLRFNSLERKLFLPIGDALKHLAIEG